MLGNILALLTWLIIFGIWISVDNQVWESTEGYWGEGEGTQVSTEALKLK